MLLPLFVIVAVVVKSGVGFNGCSENLLHGITEATYVGNRSIESEGVVYTGRDLVVKDGRLFGCICNFRNCIRKCCPKNFFVINGNCQKSDVDEFNVNVFNKTDVVNVTTNQFHMVYNNRCETNVTFRLRPQKFEDDVFYVQHDGRLYVPSFTVSNDVYDPDQYCLDTFDNENGGTEFNALICDTEVHVQMQVIWGECSDIFAEPVTKA